MVISEERIELHSPSKERLLYQVIASLSGAFILILSLLLFIYAPGKTTAKHGTVIDIYNLEIAHIEDSSHVHVLLDNADLVPVSKPNWVHFSEYEEVILKETKSLFGGVKRYSLYNEAGQDPLELENHLLLIKN